MKKLFVVLFMMLSSIVFADTLSSVDQKFNSTFLINASSEDRGENIHRVNGYPVITFDGATVIFNGKKTYATKIVGTVNDGIRYNVLFTPDIVFIVSYQPIADCYEVQCVDSNSIEISRFYCSEIPQ